MRNRNKTLIVSESDIEPLGVHEMYHALVVSVVSHATRSSIDRTRIFWRSS